MDISNFYNVFNDIERSLLDNSDATFDIFHSDTLSSLIVNSGGLDIFRMLMEQINSHQVRTSLHVLTHERDEEAIRKICEERCEIITFSQPLHFDVGKMNVPWDFLREKDFDITIFTYNNRNGFGYENVEELILQLKRSEFWSFNCYSEFRKTTNAELHLKSRKLYTAMCEWAWECERLDKEGK